MRFNQRQLRGMAIVATGGQIERVNDRLFLVKSQSSTATYSVRWVDGKLTCNCKDAQSGQYCKHRTAVDFLKRLPEIILANQKALVRACPACGSNTVISKGRRYNKKGSVRIFLCKSCGKKFPEDASSELGRPALTIVSVDLYYRGLSFRDIREHLEQIYGERRAVSTIHEWVMKVTRLLINATMPALPKQDRKRLLLDEMKIRVNGEWRFLWNALSPGTRMHVVSLITEGRSTREALRVLNTAISRIGGPPKELVTDGLGSYVKAVKASGYKIKHIRHVRFKDQVNNNQVESLNGTVRAWTKVKRGLKGHAQDLLEGRRIWYNSMRPNSVIGRSPSGLDAKWVDLVSPSVNPPSHKKAKAKTA